MVGSLCTSDLPELIASLAVFGNLPSGQFCSHLTDFQADTKAVQRSKFQLPESSRSTTSVLLQFIKTYNDELFNIRDKKFNCLVESSSYVRKLSCGKLEFCKGQAHLQLVVSYRQHENCELDVMCGSCQSNCAL